MDDDLNTAGAIGLVFEKVRELNKLMDSKEDTVDEETRSLLENDRRQLFLAGRLLGVLHEDADAFFEKLGRDKKGWDPAEIEKMIQDRNAARVSKDYTKADEIRDRIKEMGIILEDGPGGTTWRLDV